VNAEHDDEATRQIARIIAGNRGGAIAENAAQ
jgi:hypothetical protein